MADDKTKTAEFVMPLTADERQAMQVKRLTPEERSAADAEVAAARVVLAKKEQHDRLAAEVAHKKGDADKIYVFMDPVTIVRDALPDDIGYTSSEPCSVVGLLGTNVEKVVLDKDISAHQTRRHTP